MCQKILNFWHKSYLPFGEHNASTDEWAFGEGKLGADFC